MRKTELTQPCRQLDMHIQKTSTEGVAAAAPYYEYDYCCKQESVTIQLVTCVWII